MDVDTMNAVGGKPLLDLIENLGSCPYFNSSWNDNDWNFVDVVSKIHREIQASIFFNVFVGVLDTNTSVYSIMVS